MVYFQDLQNLIAGIYVLKVFGAAASIPTVIIIFISNKLSTSARNQQKCLRN